MKIIIFFYTSSVLLSSKVKDYQYELIGCKMLFLKRSLLIFKVNLVLIAFQLVLSADNI